MFTRIGIIILLAVSAFGQNQRVSIPFPSISSTAPPYLIANIPPNSPVIAVCSSPANGVPCTNYATTYDYFGAACPNGAQDTPDPQPSACQSTGDAQGNVAFFAAPGRFDYTVCISTTCYGPYTVTLGLGATSITCSSPIVCTPSPIVDAGVISFSGSGTVGGSGVAGEVPVWSGATTLTGFAHFTYNDTFANSPTTFAAVIVGDNTTLGAFCLPSPGTGNTQCIAASSATAPRADFTLPNATGAYGANIIDVGVGTGLDQNANGTVQLQVQYRTVTCPAGLGDGLNAIPAATYPIFDCVNKLISNRIIASISCYTDNAGSSTLSATNNAGSALLTGPVTCNNTKAGGGASGTLSGATTIVPGDAVNFSFISDGASKTTTWTVVMTE